MNKWNYFHEQMELIYIIFMKIYIIFSWRCFLRLCKPWLSYRHALTVDTVHHSEGGPQVRVPSLLELVRLASEPAFWNMETGLSTYLHIYAGQLQRKHLIDGDDGHVKVFVTDGSRQTVTSFVSMYYSWMLHAHESVHGISERLKQTFVFFLLSVASR